MRYEIRGAEVADIIPACRMMWESYPNHHANDPMEFFEPFQDCDPYWEPEQLRLLWVDGKIASAVRVFLRKVWNGDQYVLMGGIGNVATHPDFLRQGFSKAVLLDSLEFMRSKGVDYSTLYAGPVALYEKVGFHVEQRTAFQGRVDGDQRETVCSRDVELAKHIYQTCASGVTGTFKREDEYWDKWIKCFRMAGACIVYAAGSDAYVIYTKITEAGDAVILDAAGTTESLADTFRKAFGGCRVSVWDVSSDHIVLSALDRVCIEKTTEPTHSFMVQQLSDKKLPSAFNEMSVDHF